MRAVVLLLLWASGLTGQDTLRFEPWFDDAPLVIADEGADAVVPDACRGGAGVRLEAVRVYVSGIALLRAGTVVYRHADSYHLLDAALPESLAVPVSPPEGITFDAVRFTVGVDSARAAAGVAGGALDPVNGMYWTWRSGYINAKIEGTAPECPARGNRFQFHVGGFRAPNNSERSVTLPATENTFPVIRIDLDQLLAGSDLRKNYRVMLPGPEAMALADRLAAIFTAHDAR